MTIVLIILPLCFVLLYANAAHIVIVVEEPLLFFSSDEVVILRYIIIKVCVVSKEEQQRGRHLEYLRAAQVKFPKILISPWSDLAGKASRSKL